MRIIQYMKKEELTCKLIPSINKKWLEIKEIAIIVLLKIDDNNVVHVTDVEPLTTEGIKKICEQDVLFAKNTLGEDK